MTHEPQASDRRALALLLLRGLLAWRTDGALDAHPGLRAVRPEDFTSWQQQRAPVLRRKAKVTAAQVRRALARSGTYAAAARALGINERSLRLRAERLGVKPGGPRTHAGVGTFPAQRPRNEAMQRMRSEGASLAAIGKRYGMSAQAVWSALRRLSVPPVKPSHLHPSRSGKRSGRRRPV